LARIAGVNIPTAKKIEVALTYIFGIGRKTAQDICAKTGVSPDLRVHQLSDDQVAKIREEIDSNILVEGELRREVGVNIKRLMDLGCYRVCGIVKVCRFVVRVLNKMPELVKVNVKLLLIRRNSLKGSC